MDLNQLNKRLKQLANNVERNSDMLTKRVAASIDSVVVVATPVDTGRARSNWQAAINRMLSIEIPPYSPGSKGSTQAANSQNAINQALSVIQNYKSGNEIHITNNVSYIGELNSGKSPQAESGFVEEAVDIGISRIKGASLLTDVKSETIE